jgi:4-amino-4-deoxy-L-arabinose transferase-like glycosyltransferase
VLPPALALVLVGAAALKLLQLLLSHSSPFYEPAVLDAKYYHEWALRIAGGDLLGDGVFYGLPLYPYFLAACYALVGPVVLVPKLAQVALGVATIFLVYRIGERLDTAATGLLAAVLAAFYGPLLFHETLLVPESLAVPLYAAGLYLCCVFLERPSLGRGALVGFVLGVACLTKAGAIPFVLGFALACLLRPSGAGGRLVAPVLALMLTFLATLAPVTLHNVLWGRDTVLLTLAVSLIYANPRLLH